MQKVKRTSLVEKDELLLQKVMKISAEQNQIEVNAKKIDTFSTLCAFLKKVTDDELTITIKKNLLTFV